MAVKIKLKRLGKMRNPQYRIIIADARTKRDGRAIEEIGRYHPKEDPSLIEVNSDRAQYWLGVGAQPTEAVAAILRVTGDWQKFRGEPGAEGTLRVAEPKVSKKAAFEAAAKETHDEPKAATTPRKRATKAAEGAGPAKAAEGAEPAKAAEGAEPAKAAETDTAVDEPAVEAAPAEEPTTGTGVAESEAVAPAEAAPEPAPAVEADGAPEES